MLIVSIVIVIHEDISGTNSRSATTSPTIDLIPFSFPVPFFGISAIINLNGIQQEGNSVTDIHLQGIMHKFGGDRRIKMWFT